MLKVENGSGFKGETENEGEFEYFVSLVETVVEFKDIGTIPLISRIGFYNLLYVFGEDVVDGLLEKLKDENPGKRRAAINGLTRSVREGYINKTESKTKIKKALLDLLINTKYPDKSIPWYEIRKRQAAMDKECAIKALSIFGNKDLIPMMEKYAKEEPYHIETEDSVTGKKAIIYPVREAAKETLEILKKQNN